MMRDRREVDDAAERLRTLAPLLRLDCIRPGDVLLSRGAEFESTLMAKLSGGRWSHAAIWIPVESEYRRANINNWLDLQLIEADEFGIGATPLRQLTLLSTTNLEPLNVAILPGNPIAAILLRHPLMETLTEADIDRASQYMRDTYFHRRYPTRDYMIGAAASIPAILRSAIRFALVLARRNSKNSQTPGPFCSELTASFFEALKIPLFRSNISLQANEVSPNHLSASYSALKPVREAILNSEELQEQLAITSSSLKLAVSRDAVLPRLVRQFFRGKTTGRVRSASL